MKAMMLRTVYALVTAMVVAGGMLMTAKPAAAASGCFLITHFSNTGSHDIVVNSQSWWKGHAKHGDIWLADVPCEDEIVP